MANPLTLPFHYAIIQVFPNWLMLTTVDRDKLIVLYAPYKLRIYIYHMAGNFGGKILWRIAENMSFGGIYVGG